MRSTKRKRRTYAELDALDLLLRAHLDADGTPKAFAYDHGITVHHVYLRSRALGYRAVFIGPSEQQSVFAMRKARKVAA